MEDKLLFAIGELIGKMARRNMLKPINYSISNVFDTASQELISSQVQDVVKTAVNRATLQGLGSGLINLLPGAGTTINVTLLAGITWKMYYDINQCLGISFSQNTCKSIATGIASNLGGMLPGAVGMTASAAVGCIPGIGPILSALGHGVTNRSVLYASAVIYVNVLSSWVDTGSLEVNGTYYNEQLPYSALTTYCPTTPPKKRTTRRKKVQNSNVDNNNQSTNAHSSSLAAYRYAKTSNNGGQTTTVKDYGVSGIELFVITILALLLACIPILCFHYCFEHDAYTIYERESFFFGTYNDCDYHYTWYIIGFLALSTTAAYCAILGGIELFFLSGDSGGWSKFGTILFSTFLTAVCIFVTYCCYKYCSIHSSKGSAVWVIIAIGVVGYGIASLYAIARFFNSFSNAFSK